MDYDPSDHSSVQAKEERKEKKEREEALAVHSHTSYTLVTPESFMAWKKAFDAERKIAKAS